MSTNTNIVIAALPAGEYGPAGAVPPEDLIPFCACICCVTSCYTAFPDCIGCVGRSVCLCLYSEFHVCKPGRAGLQWKAPATAAATTEDNVTAQQELEQQQQHQQQQGACCTCQRSDIYCAPFQTVCMVRRGYHIYY